MSMSLFLQHHFCGGIYAKETHIQAGSVLVQHKHTYSHLSILASGTVELDTDGVRSVHTGPCCFELAGSVNHGVKAITDTVWFCVHATTETDAKNIDETLIEAESSNATMAYIAATML
jgi:quercetin dioxygenase-like cupin family protein